MKSYFCKETQNNSNESPYCLFMAPGHGEYTRLCPHTRTAPRTAHASTVYHRVHVREDVARGDAALPVRVLDERVEEVHGGDHEQIRVLLGLHLTQWTPKCPG